MTEQDKENLEQVKKMIDEKCKELWEGRDGQVGLSRVISDFCDEIDRPYFESFEVKSKEGPNNSILVDITFTNPNQTLQRIFE